MENLEIMKNLEKKKTVWLKLSYKQKGLVPYTVTDKTYIYSGNDEILYVDGYHININYDQFLSKIKINDIVKMLFNIYGGKKTITQCEEMLDKMYVTSEYNRMVTYKEKAFERLFFRNDTHIAEDKLHNLFYIECEDLDLINFNDKNMVDVEFNGGNIVFTEDDVNLWGINTFNTHLVKKYFKN